MAIRFSQPVQNLASVDLKRDSRIKFDKVPATGRVPGTFSGQVPLEMLISGLTDDKLTTDYYSQAVYIDPADYDGLVASWFQACLRVISAPKSISLIDENGTVYQTITVVVPTDYMRIRGGFTLDPVNPHFYRFLVPAAVPPHDGDLEFFDCKILLDVVNSNRVKIQILLTAGTEITGGFAGSPNENNRMTVADLAASFAYSFVGLPVVIGGPGTKPFFHNLILKDESKLATIESWELEVIAYHFQTVPCGCAANCKAALFNATTGSMVTGSEVGPWSPGAVPANPERKVVMFSNNTPNFTDLDEFQLKCILDPAMLADGCQFRIARAALYVTLTGEHIKAQIYHKLSLQTQSGGINTNFDFNRYLHEPMKYNPGTIFMHEVTGLQTTPGAGVLTCWLKDLGLTDVGVAGVNVVGSDLTLNGIRTRWRSGPLALTDQFRYFGRDVRTLGLVSRMSHSHHFLIAEVPSA